VSGCKEARDPVLMRLSAGEALLCVCVCACVCVCKERGAGVALGSVSVYSVGNE